MKRSDITIEYVDSPRAGPRRNRMRTQPSLIPKTINNCCYCSLTICTGGLCGICWIGSLFGICPKCKT